MPLKKLSGQAFDLIEATVLAFCWVADFFVYTWDNILRK
jgi:hypothetical protein